MASKFHSTIASAQQPDLRPFVVYDQMPAKHVPFVVNNHFSDPLLRQGETVVVDAGDREPAEGELFVIQWMDGSRDIVETFSREGLYGCGPNGEFIRSTCWYVGAYSRPRSHEELMERLRSGKGARGGTMVDGPFATEGRNAGHLNTKLVGRVVGILDAVYDEPKRIAA